MPSLVGRALNLSDPSVSAALAAETSASSSHLQPVGTHDYDIKTGPLTGNRGLPHPSASAPGRTDCRGRGGAPSNPVLTGLPRMNYRLLPHRDLLRPIARQSTAAACPAWPAIADIAIIRTAAPPVEPSFHALATCPHLRDRVRRPPPQPEGLQRRVTALWACTPRSTAAKCGAEGAFLSALEELTTGSKLLYTDSGLDAARSRRPSGAGNTARHGGGNARSGTC